MPGAAEQTGWCPSLGTVGPMCSTKGGGRCISSRGHIWALSDAAQPAAATFTYTTGCSSHRGHSQHSEASQRSGEGAGGGCPGGIPHLRARGCGHRTTGCHILPAGEGAEKDASGDRGCADMGLCGLPETKRRAKTREVAQPPPCGHLRKS